MPPPRVCNFPSPPVWCCPPLQLTPTESGASARHPAPISLVAQAAPAVPAEPAWPLGPSLALMHGLRLPRGPSSSRLVCLRFRSRSSPQSVVGQPRKAGESCTSCTTVNAINLSGSRLSLNPKTQRQAAQPHLGKYSASGSEPITVAIAVVAIMQTG